MTSQRLFSCGILACSLVVAGCSDSSPAGGAGGSLGKDGGLGVGGSPGSGGIIAHGGNVGAGGSGATAGSVGAGGAPGKRDAGSVDARAPIDGAADLPAGPIDAALDGSSLDTGGSTFAQVEALIAARCAGCHTGTGTAATRLDLTDNPDAATTLYTRLLGPVLLETYCGETIDAGGDAAAARRAIVPGDPPASFLYLKITGTQPSPGNPPAKCGSRMPRVFVPGVDGGAATFPSCDSLDGGVSNCLGAADIELIRQWILEGAPAN